MTTFRIALANLRFPATRRGVGHARRRAIAQAATERAGMVCFPECFVPGYRGPGKPVPPPDPAFLDHAWAAVAAAAATAQCRGRPRHRARRRRRARGHRPGHQSRTARSRVPGQGADRSRRRKAPIRRGSGRRVFQAGPLTFGVAICHEGWRYPETVRWAVRRGHSRVPPALPRSRARQLPALDLRRSGEHLPREGGAVPRRREHLLLRDRQLRERGLADHLGRRPPRRNAARPSAVRRAGLLIADLDLDAATGLLASRCASARYDT